MFKKSKCTTKWKNFLEKSKVIYSPKTIGATEKWKAEVLSRETQLHALRVVLYDTRKIEEKIQEALAKFPVSG